MIKVLSRAYPREGFDLKRFAKMVVMVFLCLIIVDTITTFWFTTHDIGVELNPMLIPFSGTWWLFPVMILPPVLLGLLAIWLVRRIPKMLSMLVCSGFVLWAGLELFLIINNVKLILTGVSIL